jgi:hypothetical protein
MEDSRPLKIFFGHDCFVFESGLVCDFDEFPKLLLFFKTAFNRLCRFDGISTVRTGRRVVLMWGSAEAVISYLDKDFTRDDFKMVVSYSRGLCAAWSILRSPTLSRVGR